MLQPELEAEIGGYSVETLNPLESSHYAINEYQVDGAECGACGACGACRGRVAVAAAACIILLSKEPVTWHTPILPNKQY